MRCLWIFTLLVATTGFIAGCGGGDSSSTPANEGGSATESTDQAAESQADGQASTATPAEVVHDFLEAARTGKDEQVALLLTPTARTEVGRIGLNVAPPASDTARFEVGRTQKVGETGRTRRKPLDRAADPEFRTTRIRDGLGLTPHRRRLASRWHGNWSPSKEKTRFCSTMKNRLKSCSNTKCSKRKSLVEKLPRNKRPRFVNHLVRRTKTQSPFATTQAGFFIDSSRNFAKRSTMHNRSLAVQLHPPVCVNLSLHLGNWFPLKEPLAVEAGGIAFFAPNRLHSRRLLLGFQRLP